MLVLSLQAIWFRERMADPETAVRAGLVVMGLPAFHQDLRFVELVEQLAVQKLLMHLGARMNKQGLDKPERKIVIEADCLRHSRRCCLPL